MDSIDSAYSRGHSHDLLVPISNEEEALVALKPERLLQMGKEERFIFIKELLLKTFAWKKSERQKNCEVLAEVEPDVFMTSAVSLLREEKISIEIFSDLCELLKESWPLSSLIETDPEMIRLGAEKLLEIQLLEWKDRQALSAIRHCEQSIKLSEFVVWNHWIEDVLPLIINFVRPIFIKKLIRKHLDAEPECIKFAGKEILQDTEFLLEVAETKLKALSFLDEIAKEVKTFFFCEKILRNKFRPLLPRVLRVEILKWLLVNRKK